MDSSTENHDSTMVEENEDSRLFRDAKLTLTRLTRLITPNEDGERSPLDENAIIQIVQSHRGILLAFNDEVGNSLSTVPLHQVVVSGCSVETVKIVNEAHPSAIDWMSRDGYNLIHQAARHDHIPFEVFKYILDEHPDVIGPLQPKLLEVDDFFLFFQPTDVTVSKLIYLLEKDPSSALLRGRSERTLLNSLCRSDRKWPVDLHRALLKAAPCILTLADRWGWTPWMRLLGSSERRHTRELMKLFLDKDPFMDPRQQSQNTDAVVVEWGLEVFWMRQVCERVYGITIEQSRRYPLHSWLRFTYYWKIRRNESPMTHILSQGLEKHVLEEDEEGMLPLYIALQNPIIPLCEVADLLDAAPSAALVAITKTATDAHDAHDGNDERISERKSMGNPSIDLFCHRLTQLSASTRHVDAEAIVRLLYGMLRAQPEVLQDQV